jgi:hypothetical protein
MGVTRGTPVSVPSDQVALFRDALVDAGAVPAYGGPGVAIALAGADGDWQQELAALRSTGAPQCGVLGFWGEGARHLIVMERAAAASAVPLELRAPAMPGSAELHAHGAMVRHDGLRDVARFDSPMMFVVEMVVGLNIELDGDQLTALTAAAATELAPYLAPDGTVLLPLDATVIGAVA